MLRLIYRFGNITAGAMPVQVTDGLPRIGARTLAAAAVLSVLLGFGFHMLFKGLTGWLVVNPLVGVLVGDPVADTSIVDPRAMDRGGKRWAYTWAVLNAPLYAERATLENTTAPSEVVKYDKPVLQRQSLNWLYFDLIGTYFGSDVSAIQIYEYLLPECNRDTAEAQKACQQALLKGSYYAAGHLKKNALFIAYRLQSGPIQFICLYIFSIGVLILFLRERRAAELLEYALNGENFGKRFSGVQDKDLTELSFREYMFKFWQKKIADNRNNDYASLEEHLRQFRTILYEPGDENERKVLMSEKAAHLRRYHSALSMTVQKQPDDLKAMTIDRRHREVLPRMILRVIAAFVVDQAHFPNVARERAAAALEHSVDELAAVLTVDRDLFSRCVELVPVVGFFGTVWGLSLAMLGANDVIRAQDSAWFYNLAENATFVTQALIDSKPERQQLALDGMLSALSIKFDTTGYALLLMFFLIIFGARAARREDRALSIIHSTVNESTLSVLPTYGNIRPAVLTLPPPVSGAAKTDDLSVRS
ncbi:MotA/TolQ/ExbB proton channel family protein [Bosea sp. CRIB-10]|uniref:MotA/TolQ/ExbB proton channel family protein n=1 Tax=Bosea sp. CRIB-10 TaxID=378404 RepID=UPI0008EEA7CD|nr:MotA/TolQ/ExbB proton channel family protein [Bosea sp. CRIB-10]SFD63709.1 MotA/TolQ/ExbB proton channel family protein [Bosea sp. CRIB-10]